MMDALIEFNRYAHIVVGFVGLASWWVPIVTKKGGQQHKLFGKVFAVCAYTVGTTALLGTGSRLAVALWRGADVTDNVESFGFLIFLAYLGIVTLAITHFAILTVRTRRSPDTVGTPLLKTLMVGMMLGSVTVIAWALLYWSSISIILLALSPIGLGAGSDIRRYIYNRPPQKMAWFYAHMNAMLGAGIAFHTAFLVFGSRIVIDLSVLGAYNWVPWVLPGIIGTVGGRYWERMYRRKFGDLPGLATAG